jgi:hypothetical protein
MHPQQQRDEGAVKLMRHMFHDRFCQEENVEAKKKGFVAPVYFFGWLDKWMGMLDAGEICEHVGVDRAIWDFVKEVLDGGMAIERFNQVWYNIVLGDRAEPKHKLATANFVMLLTWEDGTRMPIQVFVSSEMLEQGGNFTDGHIACLVSKNTMKFTEILVEQGMDALHDQGKNYRGNTPEDPFEVCMGLMISPIKFNTLREDLKPCCELYARMFQAIMRPMIPPEVKLQIERQRRQAQNPKKALGGWDDT